MSEKGVKNSSVLFFFFVIIAFFVSKGLYKSFFSNKKNAQKKANTERIIVNKSQNANYSYSYEIPKYTKPRVHSQIIKHFAYTVDYNEEWLLPNWVAYSLTSDQTKGYVERYNKFVPDPKVRGASAQHWDYKNSGYERGHMVPAGDMKWNETAMMECFYLSNICPQNPYLNEGDWNYLENRVRGWANYYGKVFVACGPIVTNIHKVIGRNCIAVPDYFYKVVLCNMNGEWNAIGFIMPNNDKTRLLSAYCCSVDYVEEITGIDFFSALSDDIENKIEAKYDKNKWRIK